MRRIVFGGLIGGLPGMLIAQVPFLLHQLGYITADQSQIGFIGVPLLFLGLLINALRDRPGLLAAAVSAVIAVAARDVEPAGIGLLGGALCGMATAALVDRRAEGMDR